LNHPPCRTGAASWSRHLAAADTWKVCPRRSRDHASPQVHGCRAV